MKFLKAFPPFPKPVISLSVQRVIYEFWNSFSVSIHTAVYFFARAVISFAVLCLSEIAACAHVSINQSVFFFTASPTKLFASIASNLSRLFEILWKSPFVSFFSYVVDEGAFTTIFFIFTTNKHTNIIHIFYLKAILYQRNYQLITLSDFIYKISNKSLQTSYSLIIFLHMNILLRNLGIDFLSYLHYRILYHISGKFLCPLE